MAILFNRLFFSILLVPAFAFAQNPDTHTSFGLQVHYGSYLTSLTRAMYIKDSYSYSAELSYIRQTDGSRAWHRANNLPQWGLAAFFGNSGSRSHIGALGGIFGFIDFRLVEIKRFRSSFRAGGGLGFIEKPYDPITNHKNLLLGSRTNIYLNFLWKNEIRIREHLFFNTGISFSHLSNGRMVLPNLGLNTPAFSAGLRYARGRPLRLPENNTDSFIRKTGVQLFSTLGWKQVPTTGARRYMVNALMAEAHRQFAAFGRYGAGILLTYDRSAGNHYADTIIPRKEVLDKPFNPSFYISYEQLLGKFSIPVQFGFYLGEHNYGEAVFQSFGLRYQMGAHWQAGIHLKTHVGHADFIHTGIGYCF